MELEKSVNAKSGFSFFISELMSKKKVLIVCDKNPCTSFGRLSLDICKALLSRNFDAEILWLVTPKYFQNGEPENGKSIFAKSLYMGFFTYRKPLRKIVKQFGADIVFFIRPELGFLVPTVRALGVQTVLMVHDTFAETLYKGCLKFKLINRFFVDNTRAADAFVYNSEFTCAESEKYFGVPRLGGTVVGCPIDEALFCRAGKRYTLEERKVFFQKFGVESECGVCLNISLDEARKNIDTFFKTAALRPDVAFVRVGKLRKETRQRLERMHLKNVYHFENLPAETLVEFYRNASLFMYPSFLEGFGLPPLEALACGTPVVCSCTSALKENLQGVVPLVEPADNAEAYAKIVDRVLAQEQIVNEEAAKALLKNFSLEAFADRLEKALSV